MVKAVEDTVRVNYFTFLDCLEGTLRRVELGQDSRDRAGAASEFVEANRSFSDARRTARRRSWRPAPGGYCSGRCLPEAERQWQTIV